MEKLLNLKEISSSLATTDTMIMQLIARRMELAEQVGKFKRQSGEKIFRSDIEDRRIDEMRKWAVTHKLNPHLAESILYSLINESCKLQMIQLQEEMLDVGAQAEDEWYANLKRNLLALTERWCSAYDETYEKGHFATRACLQYECEILSQEIEKLTDRGLLLDLGCATGRMSFQHHSAFTRIVGYDISQYMRAQANRLAETKGLQSKCTFDCIDLEDGIPLEDSSVSFAVMNLGTASDVRNIRRVIAETARVLKSGGRFFFSFYNRDALVYQWDFLPWQAGLATSINVHRDSLYVHTTSDDGKDEIIPVYAKAYTRSEVQQLFSSEGVVVSLATYPTISAVLPDELFNKDDVQESIVSIDKMLVDTAMGAYIIATGQKP